MNLLRFKAKSLIYITEDIDSITKFSSTFDELFSNIIYTKSYDNIVEQYFESIDKSVPIDLILFDLNKNSLNLLKEIRKNNTRIPIVLISSDYSQIAAAQLVNLRISYCFDADVKVSELIKEFFICIQNVEKRILSAYLDLVAVVTRLDLNHNYIYINDKFEKVSNYKKEELLGKNTKLLQSTDISSQFYTDMFTQLKNGENWSGIIKNITKDKDEYHLNTSIFPIFDSNKKIREYLSIAFLVTNDIEKISKLKKYIIAQKTKSMQSNKELEKNMQDKVTNALLNEKKRREELSILILDLEIELKKTQKEKRKKTIQFSELENVLKRLKGEEQDYFIQSKVTIKKLAEMNRVASLEKVQTDKKNKTIHDKLAQAQVNIDTLQGYIEEYRRKIVDLKDIISSNEKDLTYLKSR